MDWTGSSVIIDIPTLFGNIYYYHAGGGDTYTEYGGTNPGEDWAESLAAYLVPNVPMVRDWRRWGYTNTGRREMFVFLFLRLHRHW